jgi:hypothetical protein
MDVFESLAFEKSKSGFLFFDFQKSSPPAVDRLERNSDARLTFVNFPREEYPGSLSLNY